MVFEHLIFRLRGECPNQLRYRRGAGDGCHDAQILRLNKQMIVTVLLLSAG